MKKIIMTLTALSILLSPLAFAKSNGSKKGSSSNNSGSKSQYQHKNETQNKYQYKHKNEGQSKQNKYQQENKNKEYYDYGISEKKGSKK